MVYCLLELIVIQLKSVQKMFCQRLAVDDSVRQLQAGGVRPSSVAAMSASTSAQELTKRLLPQHLAAPGDGRTPSLRRDAQLFIHIPEACAAPRPLFRERRKVRFRRIVLDVPPRFRLVLAVTHVSVPIAFLPKLSL